MDDMSGMEPVAFLIDTADQKGQVDLNVQGSALSKEFIGIVGMPRGL